VSLGLAAAALLAAQNFSQFPSGGWQRWSPRDEIAPRVYVDSTQDRGSGGSLAVSGNSNVAVMGGWEKLASVTPGRWYRFTAYYRADGLREETFEVLPRLDWRNAQGKRAGQPLYVSATTAAGAWKRVFAEAQAPANASAVAIQLFLQNAPQATVWWDDISLEEIPAPAARPVRIAAVFDRPQSTGSREKSIEQFVNVIARSVPADADVILLPEGATVVGTGKKYEEVAETIPGPTTTRLAAIARERKAYIAVGLYEREGVALYNTAVLIDRGGRVVGKYRKVYLPREEVEAGLTPGTGFPVFDTDFGRVGLMICWDVQYTDPARALALQGAEIILMPIWGGHETLAKARAIENHLYLVSSGYDFPTMIIDPSGEVLSRAAEKGSVATASIDLAKRWIDPWLGELKGRFQRESRRELRP
jgi:predicted amidohydrolase